MPDMINHPPHYEKGGIEAIDVIEAWNLDFCLGSVIKYICRLGQKGDEFGIDEMVEDLKKARWYITRSIKKLEREEREIESEEEQDEKVD